MAARGEGRLLAPGQWIRLPSLEYGQQLDLRRRLQPSQPLLVDPFSGCEVDDPTHDLKAVVDRANLPSLLPFVSDPRLHRPHVEAIERDPTDEWHQIL